MATHPLSAVPALSSNPTATAALYVDFNGDPATTWGYLSVPATPAFDRNADASTFSDSELDDITHIWQHIAEKFSPFNLNVTTVDPGNLNDRQTLKVVIGGNGDWAGSTYAGISQPGGFYMSSAPNVAYVFPGKLANGDPTWVAEVASHEAGHTFGLVHSTVAGNAQWNPIMSTSLNALRRTWWSGAADYGVQQDDLAMISGSENAFGYRADDHGNSIPSASSMTLSGNNAAASGIITHIADSDLFSFTASAAGALSVNAAVAPYGAMLDLKLELRNAAGTLLASADTSSLGETLSFNLPAAGNYFLSVASHGTYGDIGQYSLSAILPSSTPAPPVANAGGTYTVAEGGTVQLSGSLSTGTSIIYDWDLDNDGIFGETGVGATRGNETGASPTYAAIGLDNGSKSISLRVTDSAGQTSTISTTVSVTNVAPTIAVSGNNTTNEGAPYSLTLGAVTDPGVDTVNQWIVDWGDGNTDTYTSGGIRSHTYVDGSAVRSIVVRLTDEDGTHNAATKSVTLNNVAPTLTLSGNASVTAGSNYTLSLSESDPGVDTITRWDINWGDGSTQTLNSNPSSVNHAFAGHGNYTITATATDEDGTYIASPSVALQVFPIPPVSNPGGSYSVNEGDTVQLSGSSSTGIGASYAWDLDNDGVFGETGSSATRGNETGATPTFSAVDLDNGDRIVHLRVTDSAGQTNTASATISIANVAPILTLSGAATTTAGLDYTLTLSANDPGPDTIQSWQVSWGDGTVEQFVAPSPTAHHVFAEGSYSIAVTAVDEDGIYAKSMSVLASAEPDVQPPVADAGIFSPVIGAGDATYSFTLTYTDDVGVQSETIDGNDVLVTGPGSFAQLATLVSMNGSDSQSLIATYRVTVAAGAWTSDHNGTYMVSIQPDQILDGWGNAASATTVGQFTVSVPPPPDYAGNDRATARNTGTFAPGRTSVYRDSVGPADVQDYYRFKLTHKSLVTIKLYELTADASLQLRTLDHKLLKSSARSGTRYELISVMLQPGSYYVRIIGADATTTPYAIRIAAAPPPLAIGIALGAPTSSVAPDFAGNDRSTARKLGAFAGDRVAIANDAVGPLDLQDYYRFDVAGTTQINVKLDNLEADASLQLRAADHVMLNSSARAGTRYEFISTTLHSGTYYVRIISSAAAQTRYTLRLTSTFTG